MTNTSGKSKVAVPASEKRKGPSTASSNASTKARHPLLRFSLGPQDDLFQLLRVRPLGVGRCIDWATLEQVQLAHLVRFHLATTPWDRFFTIIEPIYSELTLEFCTTFHLQHVMNTHDEAGTITFILGGLVRHMSVSEFGATLGLYTEEFMSFEVFLHLHCHIHHSLFCCWTDLMVSTVPYDVSRSKLTSLPPTLRYIHAILAHTLTGRRESTGVVSSTDAYFLWSMGISSMIHMRMIERRRGFEPSQYRLVHSDDQDEPSPSQGPIPTSTTESPTSYSYFDRYIRLTHSLRATVFYEGSFASLPLL
ncbi:hypothetical protein GOBAR_AA21555 [Gossypium barbadense]|uniref:Arabidopsis retrotransposon Orf1 C-terminal domain-containing protein n=1 Tax=Gossypium barbadense TaxID=3634 RepID=A0A2P5X6Y5_GOSBA|nr:hypothetical protein GOBAR_AA21555 [Gossypium barbadense]